MAPAAPCQAEHIERVLLQLTQAVNSIEAEQAHPAVPADPRRTDEILSELLVAFRTGDFHANQMFRTQQALLRSSLPHGAFNQLETAVAAYDFEVAARLVESLRSGAETKS